MTYEKATTLVELTYKYQGMTGDIADYIPQTPTDEYEKQHNPDKWKYNQRRRALSSDRSMLFNTIRRTLMEFEENHKDITKMLRNVYEKR